MVVQRTLDKIEELKERPHAHRRAIALRGAVIVAVVLVLFWGYFSVRSISKMTQAITGAGTQAQNAASAAISGAAIDLPEYQNPFFEGDAAVSSEAPALLVATTTPGRVELAPINP